MKISDAINILELSGEIMPELTKIAFRLAAKKYHPDINQAGTEMMKIINAAYDILKNYTGTIESDESDIEYPEALNKALTAIINLAGINIEICGAWVWITGDTYQHKAALKENGFRFASKKKAWHFRPDNWKSRSRGQTTMEEIRGKYGSNNPANKAHNRLTHS